MKKRVISAIVMLALFIPIVLLGGYPYVIFFAILGLMGLKELLDQEKKIPVFLKMSAYFFTLFMILYNYNDTTMIFLLNVKFFLVIWLFYFISVVIFGNLKRYNYRDATFLIGAVLFFGIVFNSFIIVRNLGVLEIIYLFLISTLTDTFALFTGKSLGKHRLSLISPNKTVEGVVGGSLFGSLVTTLIYLAITGIWDRIFLVFGTTLFLSILGQIGDLFFSSIKRHYGIKDFSNLIPGHGGVLDRLDSVIFVLLGYIMILM